MQRIRPGAKKNLNRQSRLSISALPSASLIKGLRDGDIDLDENQPESFINFKLQMEKVVKKSLIGSKIMFKNVHDFISQPTFISLFFAKISNLQMPEYRIQSKIYLRQNDMEDFLENRYVMHALSLVPNKCKDSITASNLVNKNSVAIYQILAALISFAEEEIVATNPDSPMNFVQKANQEGPIEPESLKSRSESIKEMLQIIHTHSIITEENEEDTDDGSRSESTGVIADSDIEKFSDKMDSTADEIDDDKDEKSDAKPNEDLVDPEKLISAPLDDELSKGDENNEKSDAKPDGDLVDSEKLISPPLDNQPSKGDENNEKSDPMPNEDLVDSEKLISPPLDNQSSKGDEKNESDRKSEEVHKDEFDSADLENQPDDLEEISEKEENRGKQSGDLSDFSEEQEINDDCIDSNNQMIIDEEENDTHVSMIDGEVRDRDEDDLDLLISNVEVGDLEEDDNFWNFV
ncbi:MAG: hypothetical protein MHMPM18_002146 [Marteilia pararefringens]